MRMEMITTTLEGQMIRLCNKNGTTICTFCFHGDYTTQGTDGNYLIQNNELPASGRCELLPCLHMGAV